MKKLLIFFALCFSVNLFAHVQNLYDRNKRDAKCRRGSCRQARTPVPQYYYPEPLEVDQSAFSDPDPDWDDEDEWED